MKKRIYLFTAIFTVGLCVGCGKEETESNERNIENVTSQEEASEVESREDKEIELNDELKIDFDYDYSEDITKDVDYVVSDSESLQKELENIEKVTKKYNPLAEAAQTQMEMNIASGWFFTIWDTELNSLWTRFSESADQETKEKILTEQRDWIAMKEEVTFMTLGSREENGSMYPLLWNSFLEEITMNRAYVLANELAKITGESYVMPEKSEKYGLFVDNQGTDSVYSSLYTKEDWNGDDVAIISIYRLAELEGTFVDRGNGELEFTSYDESVKGIIKINGWDGASFKVTEASAESVFSEGELEFSFPFVF